MMNTMFLKVKSYWGISILLYAFTAIFVFVLGPVIEPDTGSYLNLSMITSPGYASFLYGFKKVFGEDGYGYYVIASQLLFCSYAVYFLVQTLQEVFNPLKGVLLCSKALLLLPIFIDDYYVVNRIVSEGLAYPFFLLIIACFLKITVGNRKKFQWILICLLFAIILIRAQFYFVLPVFVLFFGYLSYIHRDIKRHLILLVSFFLLPLVTSLVEKTFHYLVMGEFANSANTGVQIMAMPLFIADSEDYRVYEDSFRQNYFKKVYEEAREAQLLDDYFQPKFNYDVYHYFHYNYIDISYEILSKKGRAFIDKEKPEDPKTIIQNNDLLISMWLPLFLDNWQKALEVYGHNILYAFGGFFRLLLQIMLLVAGFVFYHKKGSTLGLLALLFAAMTISNVLLVCLVEHSIPRFFMYTTWMLPILFVLLLDGIAKGNPKTMLQS